MKSLASAGERVEHQPDVGHQLLYREGHLAHLRHAHVLAGVEVEHQPVGRPGLAVRIEAPLRHMHFQRRLLSDPCQSGRAVDDRVDGVAGSMRQGSAMQPVRSRLRQLLLEERRLLDPVGPALAGSGPALDMRQHHRGDRRVVPEDVGFGGSGSRIQHFVGIGQRDHRTRRRPGRPHLTHHPTVLPADSLNQ